MEIIWGRKRDELAYLWIQIKVVLFAGSLLIDWVQGEGGETARYYILLDVSDIECQWIKYNLMLNLIIRKEISALKDFLKAMR